MEASIFYFASSTVDILDCFSPLNIFANEVKNSSRIF